MELWGEFLQELDHFGSLLELHVRGSNERHTIFVNVNATI